MNRKIIAALAALTLTIAPAFADDEESDGLEPLRENRERVVSDSYNYINQEAARQRAECVAMERDMQRECLLGVKNWEQNERRQAGDLDRMLQR